MDSMSYKHRRSSISAANAIALQVKVKEKQRVQRQLQAVDTTYAAYFNRRQREVAFGRSGLTRERLKIDVQHVNRITRRSNRWIVKPHGQPMLLLDVMTTLALIFTALITPYEIAFLADVQVNSLDICNWVIFLIFAAGIVVNFMLPFREPLWKGGSIIKDHRRIAKRYLQSWFVFDFISTVPFDSLVGGNVDASNDGQSAALSGFRLVRLVRLVRLLKLGRLLRAQRIIARILERLEGKSQLLTISFTYRTMFFWIVVLALSIHWFCCAWGMLALVQTSQRTADVADALEAACPGASDEFATMIGNQVAACLTDCERAALAALRNVPETRVFNGEPWICRRLAEGIITPGKATQHEAYLYLLQVFGLMEPTRPEESLLKFFMSFIFLTLDTLFKGGISGARASANPLQKAWQARMDHLNVFLKEMNVPPDLKERTRTFLRNTRDLELKRSFNTLYGNFSRGLSNEMRSHMTLSIVRGVYYFDGLETNFLRDLASRLFYEAFERGERILHAQPTLSIVVQGTVVRGGTPFGIGQCFGEDAILTSNALRDMRLVSALTYCEICCITKEHIHETAQSYPAAARRLRFEALKMAMYRAPQMIAQYVQAKPSVEAAEAKSTVHERWEQISDALKDLGEEAPPQHAEVHSYFRAINGGARLRGLASEQMDSSDPGVAAAAEAAWSLATTPRGLTHQDGLVDEDGNIIDQKSTEDTADVKDAVVTPMEKLAASHEQLAAEVADIKEGVSAVRDDMMAALEVVQQQTAAILELQQRSSSDARAANGSRQRIRQKRPPQRVQPTSQAGCGGGAIAAPLSAAPLAVAPNGTSTATSGEGGTHVDAQSKNPLEA